MEIHPFVFIGSVLIPLLITAGIITWTTIVRKRSLKDKETIAEEKNKSAEKDAEIHLWEKLVSRKEKHIDFLQRKTKE
jgi:hypothetical protein